MKRKKARIDGSKLRQCRESRDLSQEELARMAHLTRTVISNLENGYQGISFSNLASIAHALRVEVSEITME